MKLFSYQYKTLKAGFSRLYSNSKATGRTPISFHFTPEGLTVSGWAGGNGLIYREEQPGKFAAAHFALDADEFLKLKSLGCEVELPAGTPIAETSGLAPQPETWAEFGGELRKALERAERFTDNESSRYALGCVSLNGSARRIEATDGARALAQSGFGFPWAGQVLIRPNGLLFWMLPAKVGKVSVGRTEHAVHFRGLQWELTAQADTGRFPNLAFLLSDSCSQRSASVGQLTLDNADGLFLAAEAPRLPESTNGLEAVRLDLNGRVIVRAGLGARIWARPVELILDRSRYSGPPLQRIVRRDRLAEAADLGFREFLFFDAGRGCGGTVIAEMPDSRLVFMELDDEKFCDDPRLETVSIKASEIVDAKGERKTDWRSDGRPVIATAVVE